MQQTAAGNFQICLSNESCAQNKLYPCSTSGPHSWPLLYLSAGSLAPTHTCTYTQSRDTHLQSTLSPLQFNFWPILPMTHCTGQWFPIVSNSPCPLQLSANQIITLPSCPIHFSFCLASPFIALKLSFISAIVAHWASCLQSSRFLTFKIQPCVVIVHTTTIHSHWKV